MITVHARAAHVAEYKRLLLADWKRDFPDDVLALLWSLLSEDPPTEASLLKLLDPSSNGVFPVDYFRSLVRLMEDAGKFVPHNDLPSLPHAYDPAKRLAKIGWQADRLAAYLTLHAHTTLKGDADFFRDVQSLAFQAALHVVLPAIQEKHHDEHAILVRAAALFPLEYHADDPAHSYYLTATIHGYLGNFDERLRCLHAAFRFTPPSDHSFLTKAQELWAELLDHGKHKEAEDFLFSLHWSSLPSQQDEVREMMVDALKVTLSRA